MDLRNKMRAGYELELLVGDGDRPPCFEPGVATRRFTVGTCGEWRIRGMGVTDLHAELFFDGSAIWVRPMAMVLVGSTIALAGTWTAIPIGGVATFGSVSVRWARPAFRRIPPPPNELGRTRRAPLGGAGFTTPRAACRPSSPAPAHAPATGVTPAAPRAEPKTGWVEADLVRGLVILGLAILLAPIAPIAMAAAVRAVAPVAPHATPATTLGN